VPVVRLRSVVLLIALAGVQLLTVTAALAGDPSCLCDARMCIHHPGQHHSGHSHSAVSAAPPQRVEQPAAVHCAHETRASAAPRECSMRGCDEHGDELLPVSPLVSLSDPTSVARPEGVSALPTATVSSLLDRASVVEPPPPRSLPA
jgi:hypothetical protein